MVGEWACVRESTLVESESKPSQVEATREREQVRKDAHWPHLVHVTRLTEVARTSQRFTGPSEGLELDHRRAGPEELSLPILLDKHGPSRLCDPSRPRLVQRTIE